jgi:hypothetical protein
VDFVKTEKHRDTWGEVKQALGSVGRLKIFRVLLEKPDKAFTRYALEKSTKLEPVDVRANVKTIAEVGRVIEYPYQPETYKINLENKLVRDFSMFTAK